MEWPCRFFLRLRFIMRTSHDDADTHALSQVECVAAACECVDSVNYPSDPDKPRLTKKEEATFVPIYMLMYKVSLTVLDKPLPKKVPPLAALDLDDSINTES